MSQGSLPVPRRIVFIALDEVRKLVKEGWEFPDACLKVLAKFPGVTADQIRQLYDDQSAS